MPTNVDTIIAELNPDHRKKVEVRAAQLIAEEMTLRELRHAKVSAGPNGQDSRHPQQDDYWIDFERILVPQVRKWKWRMWADHGVEFFIHPAMQAAPDTGFPEFFRQDREGRPRGLVQVVKAARS
jgi:hypothetical protein